MFKMRYGLLFLKLALTFALFCCSSGGRPEKCHRYSPQEKDYIVNLLKSSAKMYNRNLWNVVAEAHGKKVEARIPGFSTKRSANALRKQFRDVIACKDMNAPDFVQLVYDETAKKPYSLEEERFINAELLSHDGNLYGNIIWKAIKKKHDEKRGKGHTGFTNKRTHNGLCLHFLKTMKRKDRIDEAVKQKFPDYFQPKRGSTSVEGENQSDARPRDKSTHCRYSDQENEFIIKEVQSHISTYSLHTWKLIAEAHKNKVEAGTLGFSTLRSDEALYGHFIEILKNNEMEVPDNVKQLYKNYEKVKISYNTKEEDFINAELESTQGDLLCEKTWEEMAKRHDEKRQSGWQRFANARTRESLFAHFLEVMVPKDLVNGAVKRKFPDFFKTERGEEEPATGPIENAERGSDDENEVWSVILQDLASCQQNTLTVDENGVDHTLFLDRRAAGDLFEPHSPHDLRTFEPMSFYRAPF